MPYTIWHDDLVLGTVDLPRGEFVASRLRPAAGYQSVADMVQRATAAFLHVGLFHRSTNPDVQLPDAYPWSAAIDQVSRLRFTLTDARGEPVATHFVNLLETPADNSVIVLVSRKDSGSERSAMNSRHTPPPTSLVAPAV
jgi:hypothetical protein